MKLMTALKGFMTGRTASYSRATVEQAGLAGVRKAPSLTDLMATSCTGYGAVIDGVLDIRTVTETKNMAAVNALFMCGFGVATTCHDPDCDCKVKILEVMRPDVNLVPVKVQADA